jgi:glc operon protein GlcG
MPHTRRIITTAGLLFAALVPALAGQTRSMEVLSLDGARRIMAAAEAEADRNGWQVTIAIVDPAGELIMLQRADGASPASVDIAQGKARTAARFRRPTKALEDAVAAGRQVLLSLEGLVLLEGGLPIEVGGRVVGGIGVSGVTSAQDAQIARAGLAALEP